MEQQTNETAPIGAVPLDCRVMPSASKTLQIEVFHQAGDEPFICGVVGHATTGVLMAIEKDCRENSDSFLDLGDGNYLFKANWFGGQYGEFGMCEQPPGWELEIVAFQELKLGA